eukprot:TRINITY_DN16562_c0_g1_i2.p1 TRINITY_DN16562_c0_g1~~TRINITY_DN16562_c0_g1_i2.p1  ORF type:complete len:385 (+),score=68.32 TRINITY_DN16562_c0_g1_i2:136-1290(+)
MPWLRAARLRSPKHMRRQPECDAGSTACDHGEDSLPVPGDVDAGWPMDSAEAQAHKDFEEAAQALADAHLNDPTLGENTMGLQETTAALHSALDGLHAKGDSAKHRSAEDAARQMQSRGFGSEDEHLRTKQMKLELRKREPRALAVAASDTIGRLCRKIAGVLRVDEKRLHLRTTFAGDDAAGILLGSDLEDAILNGHDFLCQTSETVKDAGAQKLQIYLAEGPRVATAGSDNFLRIFDLERGREILRYRHSDVVRVVAWSPAGDVVATGTADGAVRLYDLFHGELVDAFQHDLPTVPRFARWLCEDLQCGGTCRVASRSARWRGVLRCLSPGWAPLGDGLRGWLRSHSAGSNGSSANGSEAFVTGAQRCLESGRFLSGNSFRC